MIKFFDYVFYRVCKAYSKTKDSSPDGAAVAVVTLMQLFNIISLFDLFGIIKQHKYSTLFFELACGGCLLIFNYIRYIYLETNNFRIMDAKWGNENHSFEKGILTFIYIVGSSILVLILSIYLGNHKSW